MQRRSIGVVRIKFRIARNVASSVQLKANVTIYSRNKSYVFSVSSVCHPCVIRVICLVKNTSTATCRIILHLCKSLTKKQSFGFPFWDFSALLFTSNFLCYSATSARGILRNKSFVFLCFCVIYVLRMRALFVL